MLKSIVEFVCPEPNLTSTCGLADRAVVKGPFRQAWSPEVDRLSGDGISFRGSFPGDVCCCASVCFLGTCAVPSRPFVPRKDQRHIPKIRLSALR